MITINIHSFIDLITNSSTELFILDTKRSIRFVTEILQDLIRIYNRTHDSNLTFEDVFDEPYIGDPIDTLKDHGFLDPDSQTKSENIIIMSADDNSVPTWIKDSIMNIFGYSTKHYRI